jgi:hypothetical protein
MDNATITLIGQVILLPIMGSVFVLITRRVSQDWFLIGRRVIIVAMLSSVLMIVAIISAIPKPVTWWSHLFRVVSLNYCLLFSYIAVEHIVKERMFVPIVRNPMSILTTVVTILVIYIDYHRKDNLGVITDNDVFRPDELYVVSYMLNYGFIAFNTGITAWIVYRSIQPNKPMSYRVRRFGVVITYSLIMICAVSVLINVILAFSGDMTKRWVLGGVYHYAKLIYFPLVMVCSFVPEGTLGRWVQPLSQLENRKRQQQQQRTTYLYNKMVTLVPDVHLEYGQLHFEDMLVEIADARLLIWTHARSGWWFRPSAKREAAVLFDFITRGVIVRRPGPYRPQPAPQNEIRFNSAVARHLQRLEARAG